MDIDMCPCGGELEYKGVSQDTNSKLYHHLYQCTECKKAFRDNPGVKNPKQLLNRPVYKKAIDLYETFNMKPMDQMYKSAMSIPSDNNPLVHLGHVSGVIYISDKEGKKNQQYMHETKAPYPNLGVTSDGKTFVIWGGNMKVETKGRNKGWLVN